jgi:hypothetical protein
MPAHDLAFHGSFLVLLVLALQSIVVGGTPVGELTGFRRVTVYATLKTLSIFEI